MFVWTRGAIGTSIAKSIKTIPRLILLYYCMMDRHYCSRAIIYVCTKKKRFVSRYPSVFTV